MKKPPNSITASCPDVKAPDHCSTHHDKQKSTNHRSQLETLLGALDASPTSLRLDSCGDWAIFGKLGYIFIDGRGFLLCISAGESARRWFNVKQRLSFCRLTQDGDDEGCLHLDRLPTAIEARVIREALGIRKRRNLSPASIVQAISALGLKQSPANSPSAAQHSPKSTADGRARSTTDSEKNRFGRSIMGRRANVHSR